MVIDGVTANLDGVPDDWTANVALDIRDGEIDIRRYCLGRVVQPASCLFARLGVAGGRSDPLKQGRRCADRQKRGTHEIRGASVDLDREVLVVPEGERDGVHAMTTK